MGNLPGTPKLNRPNLNVPVGTPVPDIPGDLEPKPPVFQVELKFPHEPFELAHHAAFRFSAQYMLNGPRQNWI